MPGRDKFFVCFQHFAVTLQRKQADSFDTHTSQHTCFLVINRIFFF
jgi:hypothetical protein